VYFSDVDAGDSRAHIAYLDAAARISSLDKQRSYAAQQLAPGMHVLDVGCGTGDDVRTIAEIVGAHGRASGIDPSRAMIDEARARGVPPNVTFDVASAATLPFADATFDAVRAERVFQHLSEPDVCARELLRTLKPGGTALLLDQDWGSLMISGAQRNVTERIVRAFAAGLGNAWAGREARGLLRSAGFSPVTVLPMVATPVFDIAFDTVLRPAAEAALRAGAVDAEEAKQWIDDLLIADGRGEFYCAVVVIVALGGAPGRSSA
jgi:SAM-dependent methyltransferase